jgi:hypothetical protein
MFSFRLFFRCLNLGLGIFAMVWGGVLGQLFFCESLPLHAAKEIISGKRFTSANLKILSSSLTPFTEKGWSDPIAARSLAIFGIREIETTSAVAESSSFRNLVVDVRLKIEESLTLAPEDSFLWLALFWICRAGGTADVHAIQILRLSYATGANEGWVAVRRNGLAMQSFAELDDESRRRMISEFVSLVNSGFLPQAAEILVHQGWLLRDALLVRLIGLSRGQKRAFVSAVHQLGFDVMVPGLDPVPKRPWE